MGVSTTTNHTFSIPLQRPDVHEAPAVTPAIEATEVEESAFKFGIGNRIISSNRHRIRDRGVGGLRILFPNVDLRAANKLHLLDKVGCNDVIARH